MKDIISPLSSSIISPAYQCSGDIDSPFNIKSTTLSRDEFIELVRNYNPESYGSFYQIFKDNAGLIYDVATAKGINPEFVVIRAINEGFAPVSNKAPNSNNYWGIGCYNGTSKYFMTQKFF